MHFGQLTDIMIYFPSKALRYLIFVTEFVNYNCLEASKHRKRQIGNMSSTILKSVSSHLFDCLQGPYWERENWKNFKVDVESLAQSLSKYTDYLQKSCKKTMLNHMSTSPVRQISDNLTFQFLPICSAASCSQSVLSDFM